MGQLSIKQVGHGDRCGSRTAEELATRRLEGRGDPGPCCAGDREGSEEQQWRFDNA